MAKIVTLKCDYCNAVFSRISGNANRSKKHFCTHECWALSVKRLINCKQCEIVFQPKTKKQLFCSHSCAATFNNLGVRRHGDPVSCPGCGVNMSRKQKYCSKDCRKQHKTRLWLSGEVVPTSCCIPSFIREYMLEQTDYRCSECKWNEINQTLGWSPLEIDHIDGDCSNNAFDNLRVLCPNCHSLTSTYRSLNNGRSKRNR